MTAITTAGQPDASRRPDRAGDTGEAAGTTTGAPPPVGIPQLRERIDEIDDALIALWRERAALSQRVGAARVASGGTRLALSREREILDRFHGELGPIGTQLGLLVLRAGRGPL